MRPTRSLTMVDIAKRADVAVSTVSYVLSGKRSVSAETRERVERAIEELGFRPHEPARALKSRSSRTISLFFPTAVETIEVESHIFLSGVLEATSRLDYGLLVSTATHDPSGIVAPLATGRADGVILMEVRLEDDRVDRLRADSYPFSLIGRCRDNEGVNYVDFDFEEAVGRAVYHLHELGHRHLTLLNRVPRMAGTGYGPTARSQDGFEKATRALSIQGDQILSGTSGAQDVEVLHFLERTPACTAAITLSVTYAPLLAALRDLGKRVPEDFSVVAIAAAPMVDLVTPPMTTIDVPAYEMGRIGAEILIRQLTDGALPPSQILLRGPMQVRSSNPPPHLSRTQW
jgi:DNA-binding LacI/PurR family transcriptional regulator